MASEGRAEITWVVPLDVRCSSAKNVLSRSSVTTTRSSCQPSSSRTFFMRSWVMGRGVSTPSSANAIAVASGPPMKIGSVRCDPSVSLSSTMGAFVGSSTRTPTSSISTIGVEDNRLSAGVTLQRLAQHRGPEALAETGQLAKVRDGLAACVGVALLHERQHDLLEERGLALGTDLVHAQVAGLDAEPHEP